MAIMLSGIRFSSRVATSTSTPEATNSTMSSLSGGGSAGSVGGDRPSALPDKETLAFGEGETETFLATRVFGTCHGANHGWTHLIDRLGRLGERRRSVAVGPMARRRGGRGRGHCLATVAWPGRVLG